MTSAFKKILWKIVATALVLGIGVGIYWQEMGIVQLRKTRDSLLADAQARGVTMAPSSSPDTKRNRVRIDPLESARSLAADLIRRAEAGQSYRTDWAEQAVLMDRLRGMNAAQILEMIGCFEAATSMPAIIRFAAILDCLSILSGDLPEKALAIAEDLEARYPEEMKQVRMHEVIGNLIANLAAHNPDAAWEWLQKTHDGWDEERRKFMLYRVLKGTTRSDPATALHRARVSGYDDFSFLSPDTSTDNQKIATLAALRTWTAGDPSRQSVLKKYILDATLQPTYQATNRFDQVTDWIEAAALSADEFAFLNDAGSLDLSYYIEPQDTGKWIDWFALKFPDGAADRRIGRFFEDSRTKAQARAWLDALPPKQADAVKQRIELE